VGSIHGGSKHNVIPDEVHLQLTVRSYSDAVREELLGSIRRITIETCRSFECPEDPIIAVKPAYTPAAYNDPALAADATALFREILGADNVVELPAAMGGEDFGRYAKALGVPGLQFRLGSVERARFDAAQKPGGAPLPALHSSGYAPDPAPTLRTGVTALARLALSLLAPANQP
jgi:hippurate hydrolase